MIMAGKIFDKHNQQKTKRIMNTKKSETVTLIKWSATEPGAYVTGIFGVYADYTKASHELMCARESLVQNGYTIIKRAEKEVILKNQVNDRTMQMYLETFKIQ
jgi:hypothetical protein